MASLTLKKYFFHSQFFSSFVQISTNVPQMCTTVTNWLFVTTLLDLFTVHALQGMKEMAQLVQVRDVSMFRYHNQALPLIYYGHTLLGLRKQFFFSLKQLMKRFIGETQTINSAKFMLVSMILQISMNVQYQLITVMELLTVLTIQDPSAVSVEKTTLVMGYHVSPLVRYMSNYSEIIFSRKFVIIISLLSFKPWTRDIK